MNIIFYILLDHKLKRQVCLHSFTDIFYLLFSFINIIVAKTNQ